MVPAAVCLVLVCSCDAHVQAYLQLTEPRWTGRDDGDVSTDKGFALPLSNHRYREVYHGTLMAAGGFTPASAAEAVESGG
jgi:N-ethylmaleimide reductase